MNKKRTNQISEEMRRAISDVIQNKIKDPRIPIITSISSVEVTNDLSFAKVYVSVLGSDEEKQAALEGINNAKGFIKKEVSRMVKLRAMPELIFSIDDSIEVAMKMNKLINEIHEEKDAN